MCRSCFRRTVTSSLSIDEEDRHRVGSSTAERVPGPQPSLSIAYSERRQSGQTSSPELERCSTTRIRKGPRVPPLLSGCRDPCSARAADQGRSTDMKSPRVMLPLATGAGKTRLAAALLRKLFDSARLGKALFLCDRTELRDNGLTDFQAAFGTNAAEVIRAIRKRTHVFSSRHIKRWISLRRAKMPSFS